MTICQYQKIKLVETNKTYKDITLLHNLTLINLFLLLVILVGQIILFLWIVFRSRYKPECLLHHIFFRIIDEHSLTDFELFVLLVLQCFLFLCLCHWKFLDISISIVLFKKRCTKWISILFGQNCPYYLVSNVH